MSNNTQGDSSTQLQSTIEVTTDQILKFPETPSDLLVTGSALVAVVILALYLKQIFKGRGRASECEEPPGSGKHALASRR